MNGKNIGAFICCLRKENNLTQRQLAEQLGITDKAVSKWERNLSYPDITLLEPLSKLLGVTTGELLDGQRNVEAAEVKQKAVDEVLEYSKKSIHRSRKQITGIIFMLLTLGCLIAIATCLICDFAISGTLWWSIIVIGSVVYGWAVLAPLFVAERWQIFWMLVVISVGILPYLFLLYLLIGERFIFTMGFAIALVSIAAAWVYYILFAKLWHRLWFAFGLTFLVTIPVAFVINNVIVNGFLKQSVLYNPVETFINSISLLILAIVCFCMDRRRSRE